MRVRFAHEPRMVHEARPSAERAARPMGERMQRSANDHAQGGSPERSSTPSLRERLCHSVGLCLEQGTPAEDAEDKPM